MYATSVEMSPDSAAMRTSSAATDRPQVTVVSARRPTTAHRADSRPAVDGPQRVHWESEFDRIHAWARHAFAANGFGG